MRNFPDNIINTSNRKQKPFTIKRKFLKAQPLLIICNNGLLKNYFGCDLISYARHSSGVV